MTAERTPLRQLRQPPFRAGRVAVVEGGLDFVASKVKIPAGVEAHFDGFDAARGDRLVTFGWAMAEDLAGGKLGR